MRKLDIQTILTNLAPLAIKLHLTYTCNPHFHVLPGCVCPSNQPYLSFPSLLQLLIFIFFLVTSHGTNIPTSLLSFSSLFSLFLPPLIFLAHCYPMLPAQYTTTLNLLSWSFYPPAPNISSSSPSHSIYSPLTRTLPITCPGCQLYSHLFPHFHFHFPPHHFVRHEPSLFSPYPLT